MEKHICVYTHVCVFRWDWVCRLWARAGRQPVLPLTLRTRKGKESEIAQSCPTLCDPMDCSLPGSSVYGIFQAIVLEWIAISFSKESSQPRDRTRVSHIVDRRFTICDLSQKAEKQIVSINHFYLLLKVQIL